MALTTFAPSLNLAIHLAKSQGVNISPLLRDLSIDPKRLNSPDARLRLEQVLRFYEGIEQLPVDRNVWLKVGDFWHPNHLGTLGYAWLNSKTLITAFHRFARFSKIIGEGFRLAVVENQNQVMLEMSLLEPERAGHLRMDAFLSLLLTMVQHNAGSTFFPLAISLAHPAPKNTAPYEQRFQCPIHFDKPTTGFSISPFDAQEEHAPSSTTLSQLHDQIMQDYRASLTEQTIIGQVKRTIIDELPSGRISDARVARAMYMNRRTLQRRLQAENTTFKTLLTKIRMDLADRYLRDTRKSLTEICFLLGFSELSAFSRAYKRWHGHPPKADRTSRLTDQKYRSRK